MRFIRFPFNVVIVYYCDVWMIYCHIDILSFKKLHNILIYKCKIILIFTCWSSTKCVYKIVLPEINKSTESSNN